MVGKFNIKFFALLFAVVMLASLFVGCLEEPVPVSSFEPLTSKQIQEIREEWHTLGLGTLSLSALTSDKVYYGTHGECIAIFYEPDASILMEKTLEVDGVKIQTGIDCDIYIYRDGTFLKLEDAYRKGWLIKENVEAIAQHHKDVHLIFSNNPLFQKHYPNVQTVTVKERYTNELIYQVKDSKSIRQLEYSFNNWSFESAATEMMDLGCMYLITFEMYDHQLVIEYSGNDNFCRIDNKAYLLPDAFCEIINQYILNS